MKEDFKNLTEEKLIKKFKNKRLALFLICLILIIIVVSFSVYSLKELINETDISKYAGELFTELVVLVFLITGFTFIIQLLRIKDENIVEEGMKIEKTIGKRGVLFIILSFYLISYSVAIYATLISEYIVRRLILASISLSMSIPSFFLGIMLLKLNALFYNYKK